MSPADAPAGATTDAPAATQLTVADLGLPAVTTSVLGAEHVARLAATLDAAVVPGEGSPLPLLWHWAFFTPTTPSAGLGPDGHPRLPAGAPTARFPRRMWAGGRLTLLRALVVGQPAERRSTVLKTRETSGKSGDLLVVTLEHRYHQDGSDAVVEEQDLVYRAAGPPVPRPEGDEAVPAPPRGWSHRRVLEPPTLFRYSAVTFNSHRIHYDAAYATGEEGYPGLVVHGPLTATLLAEAARSATGRDLASFEFRASAPLFAGMAFSLVGEVEESGSVTSRAVRNDSQTAMSATIGLMS